MENALKLSLEQQNKIDNYSFFDQAKSQSKQYAEESGEDLGDYLMRDYYANPDGWNGGFEFAYDEISAKAKEERRSIVERITKAF